MPIDDNVFREFERRLARRTYKSKGTVKTRENGKLPALPYPRKPYAPTTLLTPEAMKAIQMYCRARGADTYEPLFISHRRGLGGRLSRVSGWAIVKRAAQALDMADMASPHKFRHFRGQQLLNEGMTLDVVQAFLGHASPETTRRIYAPTDHAVLKDQSRTFGLPASQAEESAKRRRGG